MQMHAAAKLVKSTNMSRQTLSSILSGFTLIKPAGTTHRDSKCFSRDYSCVSRVIRGREIYRETRIVPITVCTRIFDKQVESHPKVIVMRVRWTRSESRTVSSSKRTLCARCEFGKELQLNRSRIIYRESQVVSRACQAYSGRNNVLPPCFLYWHVVFRLWHAISAYRRVWRVL